MFHAFHHNRFGLNLTQLTAARQGLESESLYPRVLDLVKRSRRFGLGVLGIVLALCQICVHAQQVAPKSAAGSAASYFVPAGTFTRLAADAKPAVASAFSSSAVLASVASPFVAAAPMALRVLLYASPTTRAFMASGGYDAAESTRTWDVFLRKYGIPFQVVTSAEQLERLQPGVLLLPSAVALSEREKRAVTDFRAKGGSVLASWLTGVRNENGEWRGFDFMESGLDVKVVGNNEAEKDDSFLMPHGVNPVTHALSAGQRVWMEHAKDWYPLRLMGRNPAASIMDWSRTAAIGKSSTTMVFDERRQSSGNPSRSVVLGYPERLWRSGDPKALEAIAHNALMWLLRQPDAYVSNWPYPYASAFVMAVGAYEVIVDVDLLFAKMMEDAGGRATYYILSENALKSAKVLKQIQARGHEVAFHGDRFELLKDKPLATQSKRLDTMISEMKAAGFDIAGNAGFRPPMDSYDQTTERLLKERGIGHVLAFMGTTESRLPYFAPADADTPRLAKAMVVLPRTQGGPEDLLDIDPDTGLDRFLSELAISEQMAGLSVASVPNQSLLTNEQQTEIFKQLKARQQRMWLATAGQVAEWWRERDQVSARLEPGATGPQLSVTIKGKDRLKQPVAVWVNLPESGSALRLVARGNYEKSPKVANVDAWRAAVVLDGLTPGEYQWQIFFDRPTVSGTK